MEVLDLSNNKIRGTVPQGFREQLLHWKNIETIDLSFNKLHGDLPVPPSGTKYFQISNNELSGDISLTMCNASSLRILNLAHNNLTGHIPQCLGTFPSLFVLDLQMNNLYGNMPQKFPEKNAVETIKLNGNRFEGPLPQSLAHCTKLQVLDVGNNNIVDTFPHWLETLQELQFQWRFATYFKNFQGMMSVSDNQTGFPYMDTHESYNDSIVVVMKGRYMELERILTTFATIDLSNNMFEGVIPKVIGQLFSLRGLNLSHNGITGTIPESLSNMRNLEWLDLSWNHMMGEIPMALTDSKFLSLLNLSQNQFDGIMPTGGQFLTFENDSYGGNPKLCGIPLSKACNKDEEWPPHSSVDGEESGFGWKSVVVGYACGMLFGMMLGSNLFLTGKPQWLVRLVAGLLNARVRKTKKAETLPIG